MIRLFLIIWFSGARAAHAATLSGNYRDISDTFSPAFKKIRTFVLENERRQTYRAWDSGNSAFAFTALDVLLNFPDILQNGKLRAAGNNQQKQLSQTDDEKFTSFTEFIMP